MDINILIGGEAGQGLKTINSILGKTFFRKDFNIYSSKNYMSRIRGGHNFIKIRFGTNQIKSSRESIDILVAMNKETVDLHKDEVTNNGIIIFEEQLDVDKKSIVLNATEIAKEVNIKALNTVYIGAVLKILDLNLKECKQVIKDYFDQENIIEDNIKLLESGYDKVETDFAGDRNFTGNNNYEENKSSDQKINTGNSKESASENLYLDGNQAIALGALAAGLKFYTAYPMSPSTSIMSFIASKQEEMGVVVEQAEDEIGAINMALGASYGGIRAMTGTSGGGLSLMAEAMGLAGITETPLVVADVQRPGPATGLPTRTGQGDLLFAINISQGEFPLMVIAPRDHEDAFYQTFRAFNLAEKYQIPVIILSDQYLADSGTNIEKFNLDNMKISRHLVSDQNDDNYKRYEFSDDGISPRSYPGQLKGEVVLVDSDEHDQKGHITESAEMRTKMVEKRSKKMAKLKEEDLKEPQYMGPDKIDYLLISWGSTYGPVLEAQNYLNENNIETGFLSFSDVWPLPTDKLNQLINPKIKTVVIENNSTGQLAGLISKEAGIKIDNKILKYDGRPFIGKEIFKRIKNEVINNDQS